MITPQNLLIGMAIYIFIVCLPALIWPHKFRKALKAFSSDENLVRTTSFIIFIFAFLFLSTHWEFAGKWYMTISILGWLALLKGIFFLWAPGLVKKMIKKCVLLSSDKGVMVVGLFGIILGAFLIYIATELLTIEYLFY